MRIVDIASFQDGSNRGVAEAAHTEFNFKIIIVGDSGVGKTAILYRFSEVSWIGGFVIWTERLMYIFLYV